MLVVVNHKKTDWIQSGFGLGIRFAGFEEKCELGHCHDARLFIFRQSQGFSISKNISWRLWKKTEPICEKREGTSLMISKHFRIQT